MTASTPSRPTWVPGAAGSLHDVDNLPYGVAVPPGGEPRVVVRVGDHALDLAALARADRPTDAALIAERASRLPSCRTSRLNRNAWPVTRGLPGSGKRGGAGLRAHRAG